MRRNVSSHTNCNTCGTIYQKIGVTSGKYYRLCFCFIEVWYKINGIFINIRKKLHGNLGKSCFCISHCGSTITVHRTKVTMTVYQWVSGGPILSHIYQSTINRAVTMRMIFTHGITHNTSTLTMRLVGTIVQFNHRVKHSTLHRLQTVSYIGKSTGCDNTHCVVNIEFFHSFF